MERRVDAMCHAHWKSEAITSPVIYRRTQMLYLMQGLDLGARGDSLADNDDEPAVSKALVGDKRDTTAAFVPIKE